MKRILSLVLTIAFILNTFVIQEKAYAAEETDQYLYEITCNDEGFYNYFGDFVEYPERTDIQYEDVLVTRFVNMAAGVDNYILWYFSRLTDPETGVRTYDVAVHDNGTRSSINPRYNLYYFYANASECSTSWGYQTVLSYDLSTGDFIEREDSTNSSSSVTIPYNYVNSSGDNVIYDDANEWPIEYFAATTAENIFTCTYDSEHQWFILDSSAVFITPCVQSGNGGNSDSQSVEIRANVVSIYSVSLPASIELAYDTLQNVYIGDSDEITASAEGYFGTIIFGCAGKISSNQNVFITPEFPCMLNSTSSNSTVELKMVLPEDKTEAQTEWDSSEIGTCTFDGVSLSNCNYSYNDGLRIGFLLSELDSFELYKGNLIFNFGIDNNN